MPPPNIPFLTLGVVSPPFLIQKSSLPNNPLACERNLDASTYKLGTIPCLDKYLDGKPEPGTPTPEPNPLRARQLHCTDEKLWARLMREDAEAEYEMEMVETVSRISISNCRWEKGGVDVVSKFQIMRIV
ncbi:hypothetical protein HDV00_007089 [Rhizophlyctis rosea]|nr:hypothetical protein HDV00_007089 [Rhizophlyctis rosea]